MDYQGGSWFDLCPGSNPLLKFKITNTKCVKREFEKSVKGFIIICEGPSGTKMQLPKDDHEKLGLVQPFLVLQMLVASGSSFSLEVVVHDSTSQKRRLLFSTAFKTVNITPLHAQLPLALMRKGEWISLALDIRGIVSGAWGVLFQSMDMIIINPNCRWRKLFTMREAPVDTTGDEITDVSGSEEIGLTPLPQGALFPTSVLAVTQVLDMPKLRRISSSLATASNAIESAQKVKPVLKRPSTSGPTVSATDRTASSNVSRLSIRPSTAISGPPSSRTTAPTARPPVHTSIPTPIPTARTVASVYDEEPSFVGRVYPDATPVEGEYESEEEHEGRHVSMMVPDSPIRPQGSITAASLVPKLHAERSASSQRRAELARLDNSLAQYTTSITADSFADQVLRELHDTVNDETDLSMLSTHRSVSLLPKSPAPPPRNAYNPFMYETQTKEEDPTSYSPIKSQPVQPISDSTDEESEEVENNENVEQSYEHDEQQQLQGDINMTKEDEFYEIADVYQKQEVSEVYSPEHSNGRLQSGRTSSQLRDSNMSIENQADNERLDSEEFQHTRQQQQQTVTRRSQHRLSYDSDLEDDRQSEHSDNRIPLTPRSEEEEDQHQFYPSEQHDSVGDEREDKVVSEVGEDEEEDVEREGEEEEEEEGQDEHGLEDVEEDLDNESVDNGEISGIIYDQPADPDEFPVHHSHERLPAQVFSPLAGSPQAPHASYQHSTYSTPSKHSVPSSNQHTPQRVDVNTSLDDHNPLLDDSVTSPQKEHQPSNAFWSPSTVHESRDVGNTLSRLNISTSELTLSESPINWSASFNKSSNRNDSDSFSTPVKQAPTEDFRPPITPPENGTGVDDEEEVNLLYDPVLNCYYDPASNKYYSLK